MKNTLTCRFLTNLINRCCTLPAQQSLPLINQVFVEHTYSKVESYASIGIFSSDLLHGEDIIEQTFKTRRVPRIIFFGPLLTYLTQILSEALAAQWFGNYIGIKTWLALKKI